MKNENKPIDFKNPSDEDKEGFLKKQKIIADGVAELVHEIEMDYEKSQKEKSHD